MGKIITKSEYKKIKNSLCNDKKVVLCHGVFDLVHPGHIIYFQEAKAQGDILVVSITASKYVRKGPGRPYFNDEMRLMFLAAIECIDFVILSEGFTVDDIIEAVEPDLYVKGNEYKNPSDDITGKISEETELVRKHGGEVYFTNGQTFSSTRIINNAFPALSEELKQYLTGFTKKYTFQKIREFADNMQSLRVLVVGDIIIDEYIYCQIQGLMSKDMGYSARYKRSEQYLGGSLAIARHISSFCDDVTIMSVIGNETELHSRFLNDLGNKMRLDLEYSNEFKTIIKQRFITENEKREELNKIFVINNLPTPVKIDDLALHNFTKRLETKIRDFDIVVLCDFGHGLVDKDVLDIIKKAKFLTLNCQTNSSNYGLNLITKYHDVDLFTLDQKELKLAMGNDSADEYILLKKLAKQLNSKQGGILTQGSKGATSVDAEGTFISCPALTLDILDTIGAGDAFFALASLYSVIGAPMELCTFMGNIAGALAANIAGNKEPVKKVDVLKYASTLLNI